MEISVSPSKLVFSEQKQSLSYVVSFTSVVRPEMPTVTGFGSITWNDGTHQIMELLNDNDDEDQAMSVDCEWADPIRDLLLDNSPKELSSDSNLSSVSSNRETASVPASDGYLLKDLTPKQLLFDCVAAISEGKMEEASAFISELRQRVSIQGDPPQRIAAYMVEGLAARMAASANGAIAEAFMVERQQSHIGRGSRWKAKKKSIKATYPTSETNME